MFRIIATFSIVLFIFLSSTTAIAQRECTKLFRITGPKADGSGTYTTEYGLSQKCYEYSNEEIQENLKDEAKEYKGFNFKLIKSPSQKQNCAGLGFERLFGKGPYCTNADVFCDEIIYKFGKLVYEEKTIPSLTWGDVQPGDIAIYFNEKPLHVTVVNSIEKTLGATTKIVIESKCDKQGTYLHPLGIVGYMNDPLSKNYGKLKIYRVDVSKLQIEDISTPCECKIFTLRVQVLNSEDNKSVKGSNVELKIRSEYNGKYIYGNGTTDNNGEVKFKDVPTEIANYQPYIAAKKEKFKEKWSDVNAELIESSSADERFFTVYIDPDKTSGLISESLTVPNFKAEYVYTSDILELGATYLIEASGTVSDWDTKNPEGVDACYCYIKWRCPNPEPWGQLQIDNQSMHQINGSTLPYNSGHTYSVTFIGTGQKLKLHSSDAIGSSGDNSGSFKVKITKQ
jgi:hypothetical protein